ncbi:MarR family transcriptional regulator [Demequina flava]|uniref:MarR family transcriptional regulator n=1 Tax=Demequina flava TaxID=1095025 RepID=UPI0007857492|nr:MarR family transcriptional regulator [Demequina flava]
MGTLLTAAPSPVDGDWSGVSVLVPQLPSQVRWSQRSGATLTALEKASRALGRLEGAYRDVAGSNAGIFASLSIEAQASMAMSGEPARHAAVRDAFVREGELDPDGGRAVRTAALMRSYAGLVPGYGVPGWSASSHYASILRGWPSPLDFEPSVVPDRFTDEWPRDTAAWRESSTEPALVQAALAMMSIAAVVPGGVDVGIVARQIFMRVLEDSRGVDWWSAPPISWGFLRHPESWDVVSSALAVEGEPDPAAVDDALRLIFVATGHAAITTAYFVESAGRTAFQEAGGRWKGDYTRAQRRILDACVGLPGVNAVQAARFGGLTPRGVRRCLKALVDGGALQQRRTRSGTDYWVCRRGPKFWPEAVYWYSLPGEPETYE